MNYRLLPWLLLQALMIAGCATTDSQIAGSGSQVEIRQIQTREYDTLNKAMTLRSVIATLQDLSFVIDKADATLGTVTATRYDRYVMRMTVTVREKDGERIAVRANARINEDAVTDPKTYQDFFVALDKAMFLTLNKVD
jgi:starvation-inducible outer membrane lipoprotein